MKTVVDPGVFLSAVIVSTLVAANLCAAEPAAKSPLLALDAARIPASELYPWQPKELVAVIGSHSFRHWGTANAVAFSPDGHSIASGGWDGYVRLWDASGHETATLKVPTQMVNSVAFSASGRVLVAGSEEGTIFAWRLGQASPEALEPVKPSPLPERQFAPGGRPACDYVAFAAGGRYFAASFGRQTDVRIVIWETKSWPPRELPVLEDVSGPFAFSVDGKRLVTQTKQKSVAVWDLSGEAPKLIGRGSPDHARGQMLTLAISPDGKTAAACHGDGTAGALALNPKDRGDVVLWDLAADPPSPKGKFGAFKNDSTFYMTPAAAFSPQGDLFAFASDQRVIELWDVTATPPKRKTVLPGSISQAGTLAYSPDGKKLASVSQGVMEWNLAEAKLTSPTMADEPIQIATLSPRGTKLTVVNTTNAENGIFGQLWQLDTTPMLSATPLPAVPLLFAADDTLLAAELTGSGRAIRPTGLKRFDISGPGPRDLGPVKDVPLHALEYLGYLGIESRQATVAPMPPRDDKTIELFRLEASGRTSVCKIKASPSLGFNNNVCSADGHIVAAACGEGERTVAKVWDISGSDGKELATIQGKPVAGRTGPVEANKGPETTEPRAEARRAEAHAASELVPFRLWTLALSAKGDLVAIADVEGAIQVWTIGEKPDLVRSFAGHSQDQVMGAVQRMNFSPDGKELLSIGSDRKLIVWNLSTGRHRYTATFPAVLLGARIFPDRRHLLTLNPDGTLYVLRMPE